MKKQFPEDASNPHIGSDVLEFLSFVIPDTDEMKRIELRERMLFLLSSSIRSMRAQIGLSRQDLADYLCIPVEDVEAAESMAGQASVSTLLYCLIGLAEKLRNEEHKHD